jgi:hypothetical protein
LSRNIYKRESEKQSEMLVVVKAKELCDYIITVTDKSPKRFRFTFSSRMQNLAFDTIECIYRANAQALGNNSEGNKHRLEFQHRSLTALRILTYIAELAMTHNSILPRHFEQISRLSTECSRMLGAWVNSDKQRLSRSCV